MSYATLQDLVDRFGEREILQLSDRDGDGVSDSAVVAKALLDAEETVNSYIAKRVDLPLATVPAPLTRVTSELAYHFLFRADPPENVRKMYDAAIAWLKDVAAGKALLDAGGEEPAPSGQVVLADGPERTFSRETLKGF